MSKAGWHQFQVDHLRGVGDRWDDLKAPFTGRKIDVANGHLDYDFDELGIGYQDNAAYPTDPVGVIFQMPHHYKLGSNLRPHVHWIQNTDFTPNWLLGWRVYNNGEVPPAWAIAAPTKSAFNFLASALQITMFPEIDMSNIDGVSAFVDVKLFRDTANTSGAFGSADLYAGTALAKELDCHYKIDSRGSREELVK